MQRIVACALLGVFLAAAVLPPPVLAQRDAAEQQKDAELARLYERWKQTQDFEEKIAIGVQVIAMEGTPSHWPLDVRDRFNGELWHGVGRAYWFRQLGDRSDNLEKAIAYYQGALKFRTREAFPLDWAQTQHNLGLAYMYRMRGEAADNLEKAIARNELALEVRTREATPLDWAHTQSNLGLAYWRRIRGERAENVEKAITHYELAQTISTRSPQDWALTQSNLGLAYQSRVRGEAGENLEKAIAAHEAALSVYNRDAGPREWAEMQGNLAYAYGQRIRGDRADNLDKSIATFQAALTVFTREALPHAWAGVQNNLGKAYEARIHGDQADNLEKSITHFEAALTVFTREALPHAWAEVQNNLAGAYQNRIRGDRADNLERAIVALEASLTVFTREALPHAWAEVQNNLAAAYQNRIRGDYADNLEKAIVALEGALTVFTREALPHAWAGVQNNLGKSYEARIRGDRADNLEKAIAVFDIALKTRTREALPLEWAETQHQLAIAHQAHMRGGPADSLQKATVAYEAALTIYTREALPRYHLQTGRLLGRALLEARDWQKAGAAYASAREAFLLLFGQGLNDAEARDLVAEAGPLFAEAAFAATQRGENDAALALASEGRARLMAVALKLGALDLPADKRRRFDELRSAIRTADRTVEATHGSERATALAKLGVLRQEMLGLVKDADAAESSSGSVLNHARAAVAKGGAVVVPILTNVGGKILIMTKGVDGAFVQPARKGSDVVARGLTPSTIVLDLPELTTERLNALLRGDGKTSGWLGAYNINYLPTDQQNQRWAEWQDAIKGLGPELWRLFGAKLDAALRDSGVGHGTRLVWLPSGALGILPLGLAQNPANGRRFADAYEIVYAPSLDALAAAQGRISKAGPATLAAVINPTGDLLGTEKEGKLVASYFPSKARAVLERAAATPDAALAALKGKTHWHFASHGTFSWDDARLSALVMHGTQHLTVGRLLETDGLGRPRLVVLSACETGLHDIDRNPDEFIGLPGTFTALGAAGVLGTLWPVDDAATALLIAKFYELHMGERLHPPTALRRAQSWLRLATSVELAAYAKLAAKQGRLETRQAAELENELSREGLSRSRNAALVEWTGDGETRARSKKATGSGTRLARPYAHPYFWAGFIHTGL